MHFLERRARPPPRARRRNTRLCPAPLNVHPILPSMDQRAFGWAASAHKILRVLFYDQLFCPRSAIFSYYRACRSRILLADGDYRRRSSNDLSPPATTSRDSGSSETRCRGDQPINSGAARRGLPGRIPHDLRRSAVRSFVRAGLSEHVAMRLSGHLTASVFRRYDVVSEDDLDRQPRRSMMPVG